MYKRQRNYENVQRAIYDGIGEYQVPQIAPTPQNRQQRENDR